VNELGNLFQPFYYSEDLDSWYKLTYANYAFDMIVGLGGSSTSGWNNNGVTISSSADGNPTYRLENVISNLDYGNSLLKSDGTGVFTVSYDVKFNCQVAACTNVSAVDYSVQHTYELLSGAKFIKATTELTPNIAIPNLRSWIGTKDDWVAVTDKNYKTRGNIVEGAFVPISNPSDSSGSIVISQNPFNASNGTGVVFHSTSENAETIVGTSYGYTYLVPKSPSLALSNYSVTDLDGNSYTSGTYSIFNDGGYALFTNYEAQGNTSTTWYYGVEDLGVINSVHSQIGNSILGIDPTPGPRASGGSAERNRLRLASLRLASESVASESVASESVASSSAAKSMAASALRSATSRPASSGLPPSRHVGLVYSPPAGQSTRVASLADALAMSSRADTGASTSTDVSTDVVPNNAPVFLTGSASSQVGSAPDSGANQSAVAPAQIEVRIPAADGSPVDIVNGGVRLPDGVDQQLFVVSDDGIAEER
jgi:hypothetical protein